MADKITVKVEGIEKAVANLKKYQIIKRQAVKDVLLEQGFKIEADAKRGSPLMTGRLRASISTNWSQSGMTEGKTGSQAKAGDGVGVPPGEKGLTVVVGSRVAYAHQQEFGHWGDAPKLGPGEYINWKKRKHEHQKRPSGGFQFLTKAFLKHEGETLTRIKKIFRKDESL